MNGTLEGNRAILVSVQVEEAKSTDIDISEVYCHLKKTGLTMTLLRSIVQNIVACMQKERFP